ncbi:hypothetical protein LJ737_25335 [Hymenobacter sp. 15J16-1T3B]|uniref:hypothetical protein n=1 Tax=Hymenobacter sp. 15J16-1T3B TaxID=2886941 RepID=UPI001D12A7BA|nr:hypothetical protein [Hymenobacter sp. 15J16-1T3B]MCC3160586.1 hypothetical protein [Hymenobacter sp. 15J16-1T3B]
MNTRLLVLFLSLLSLTLGSCDRDLPTPHHTKAWLSQADGDRLTFRNATTGATRTLQARVTDRTYSRAGKFDFRSKDFQIITLAYAPQALPDSDVLQLQFNGDGLVEMGYSVYNAFERCAFVDTHANTAKELVYGTDLAEAERLDNLRLDGRTYERVAHVTYADGMNMILEYWYSRTDGLVAFTEPTQTGPQTWYRVW